jgi:hypothetical protein
MQTLRRHDTPASAVKWTLPLVSGLLLLASCSGIKRDPDVQAAEEMQEKLLLAPYGPATFAIAENHIALTSMENVDAGIILTLSGKVKDPVVIRFAYRDEAPLNLRLSRADGYSYFSVAQQDHFILGEGYAAEALFYKAGPFDLGLEIEEIAECGEDNFYCLPQGIAARTFSGKKLKNRLLVQSYNNAALSDIEAKAVTVSRNSSSGEFGATLNLAETSETEDFLLEFDIADAEGVSLRVDRNGQMRYFPADRGWARLNPATQLLFFTGTAGGFELKNLKLVGCNADEWRCRTAEDFDDLLPGTDGDVSVTRLLALVEWATVNSDYAASKEVAASMDITGLTPSQMYHQYYEPNVGGGYCGATAVFLAQTLRSQGYDAFTMDFGIAEEDLTHVTTIVAQEGKFYLVDATFGAYFALPGTELPMDLLAVLDGQPYEFRQFDMSGRDFLVHKQDRKVLKRLKEIGAVSNCEPSGRKSFVVCKDPRFGLEAYLESFAEGLKHNGLGTGPEALISLLRAGVFSVGDTEASDSIRQLTSELSRRGIFVADARGQ